ncbi:hypothetical protein CRE_04872 [Caenorhabditis remanei]|uniref:L-Fucosyltransferase n=1 Tax=Caenorhabditis remanei TaxID=31234 RepID=E3LYL2_CAERE|nr:hypothetical protein CRE_04872 [Caenorhabditis remanei]
MENNKKGFVATVFAKTSILMARSSLTRNNIFELASILGISRILHRTPVIFTHNETYEAMLERVNDTIPGLLDQYLIIKETVPEVARDEDFNLKCCIFENPNVLMEITDKFLHLTGLYYQSYKYFPAMQEELQNYLRRSSNNFSNLPKSTGKTFINCVHIRRGDFFDVGFHVADADFIKKAMNYIERRESRPNQKMVFIMFGDDLQFMKELFTDSIVSNEYTNHSNSIHFISQNSATEELVYSKNHCDTVFISAAHSTFGWWMGYFSKGNRVYFSDIRVTNDSVYKTGDLNPDDYYLPNWIPIEYNKEMMIVESTK